MAWLQPRPARRRPQGTFAAARLKLAQRIAAYQQ
jgi:hypothetical protein